MLFRKAALIALFILVLLAVAAGAWSWSAQTRLYSSTTARALLPKWRPCSNKEHQVVADPVANKIESRPNPIFALIQKIKKKVGL